MNLPLLVSTVATIIFGVAAILFSYKEERLRRRLSDEEAASKRQTDYINMIVHDLRAPLTSIKDAATLLLSGRGMEQSEQAKLLVLVHEQSDRMLQQVGSLLDAARLEGGRLVIHKTMGDLNKIVTDAIAVFKPQAESKRITVAMHITQEIPSFAFDQGYITEVLNNLLSNSLKFTPSGGVITVTLSSEHGNAKLAVADTGMGIPKEKQGQLFKKFSQAHDGNTRTGSGLGLYIVKGIIDAHEGSIALESEINQGTTITIILPLTQLPAQPVNYVPVSTSVH